MPAVSASAAPVDSSPTWQPPSPPRNTDLDVDAVPRGGVLAAGKDAPKAKRVKELPGKRTANGKVFELSDGRLEQELSVSPVHYRAKDGSWSEIDPSLIICSR